MNTPDNITLIDYVLAGYSNNTPWTNLGNYANYIKEEFLPLCPNRDYNSPECFGTQNGSFWAYTSNSPTRSYLYKSMSAWIICDCLLNSLACTELGAYQVAPSTYPSLVMKVLQADYTWVFSKSILSLSDWVHRQQWCNWAFPPGRYTRTPTSPDLSVFNKYGGFNISAERLAFIDGSMIHLWPISKA